jgi:hypothetical protein
MTAVTTYATLQTRIAADCNRTDTAFTTTAMPGFIQAAESLIRRRLSRTREAMGRATATINGEYELVPTDFGGVRSFELAASPSYALEYLTPDALTALKGYYQSAGKPLYYTVVGDEFQFLPEPGESYTGSLTYWRKLAALSVSNTSNWVLLSHPDAYIEGSLAYAFAWLQDEGRASQHMQVFLGILDNIEAADVQESYGATLQTRPSLVV